MGEKKGKRWKKILSAIGLAVAAGVLAWLMVYVRKRVDLGGVLAGMRPGWLLPAVLAVPAMEVTDALVFFFMGRRRGEPVTLSGCFAATFVGELYYRLGPAGAPVQLGLMVDAGFSGAGAGAVYTWKCIANTVVYGGYAGVALGVKVGFLGEDLGWALGPTAVLILGYAVLCALVLLVAARPGAAAGLGERFIRFLGRKFPKALGGRKGEAACGRVRDFCAQVRDAREDRGLLAGLFLGMGIEMTLVFAVPGFLYRGLGLTEASFWELVLTGCLVMVLARVVLLPGNAVGAEGSFYLFMAPLFGGAVTVAMVLWRLITFAQPMALGALFSLGRAAGRWGKRKKSPG